jgi:hypothetical protein
MGKAMKELKYTKGPWKVNKKYNTVVTFTAEDGVEENLFMKSNDGYFCCQSEADALLIKSSPDMAEGIIKTYKEFERLKNHPKTNLRDRIYLDGVLAVLDTYLKKPVEEATGEKIEDLI